MKISYRWLKEFVDTDLEPRAVADRLTNAGIGVESITPVVEGLAGVVVGEIEAVERELGTSAAGHVNRLVRVAVPGKEFSVVCGAPNAAPGRRAAFAPPGARLPGLGPVKAVKIRGVVSEGILCSEKELGLSDDHSGILLLPGEAPLGADLTTYLGLDDWILDIEITPNRPDALSVVGVAREIAALTGAPFRFPRVVATEADVEASSLAAVRVEAPDLCPRFCARVIIGLTVKPSPPWLAQRLRAVGLRPINNLVDVTNYIMWELGQPLHAFDLDTLAQHTVVVRRARPGERTKTLDGQERALGPDMALVCDPERAVGIGGVMGGADSEVTGATTRVLLEAAYWDPGSIRRTSRALGLSTDAAYRFERGGDIEAPPDVLGRAAQLMAELGGGAVAKGVIDVYPEPRPHRRVALRMSRVERVIGASPPREGAVRILQALGFAVDGSGDDLQVVVPSFRRDIHQEDDLVEEIVRIWGYDQIPLTPAGGGEIQAVTEPAGLRLARPMRRALNAAGLSECVTWVFLDPDRLERMGWSDREGLLALQNPLSVERSVLRPSLLPGLLEVVGLNANRQMPDVRAFEVGNVFAPHRPEDGDRPAHEDLRLGLVLTGLRAPRAWFTAARDRVDLYDAKGMAEAALQAAGVTDVRTVPWSDDQVPAYLEPGRAARLVCGSTALGWFGEVALAAREVFDLPAPVFAAELSITALTMLPPASVRYEPLPRFPAVQRDLAVVVSGQVTAGQVEAAIRAMNLPLLSRITLFDVYTGGQVGAGRRSLAWSLTFQAPDRTLTDAEVNRVHERIVAEVTRQFGAEVRGA
ncbi:MAG TPA: phenylalanine--tRNA ligase subunit beta [Methylomirabilota bacterium]|nr:phenylalanine--tRNA ligase subunit beta [Methylomirabilota bacterium]